MQLRSHTKRCRVLKEAIREATDEEPAVKIEPPELTVVNVHLPPEILHHVITFLPWQYAAQLQRVCKSLKSYINDRVLGNCYARELIGTGNPLRWALTTHSNWSDVGHNCSVPPQNVQQIAFVALGKMYMEQASISRLLGTLGPDFDNFESKVILVEMLSILERAIMAGHYQAAEMLLSYTKKDISAALDRGEISDALWEYIDEVAEGGQLRLLDTLLDLKPTNFADNIGATLFAAVEGGHLAIVERVLEVGGPGLVREEPGLLVFAADGPNTQILRLLLSLGANPNDTDMPACTALSAASFNGNLENVQVLLEYNAAVTPGALIASARSRCQDIFDYLLAHVESRETLDNALLSCTNEATGVAVRMFLEAGIGLNKVSMALSSAVEYGCTENARILLQYGADPTHMHNLPLRKAAGYGNVEMVRVLLEAGAYVNGTERTRMVWEEHHFDRCTRDVYGLPLVRAIAIGRYEVAKLLIEWEADVCWQESYALYAAVKCDEYYLYQWDSNRSLKQQVSEKRLRLLRLLVDAGARVDSFGGTRALAAAAESPTPDKRIIRFLLEQQADLATARRKSCKAFEALSDESLVAMRIGYKRKDKLTPPKASTKSTTKSTTKKSTIRSTTDPTQSAPAARKKSASKKRSR